MEKADIILEVLDARVAHDDFDPRRASAGKRYRYLLLATPVRDPLLRDRVWHLWGDLDLGLMQHEADALVGHGDAPDVPPPGPRAT